jgi:site-specific recombinase XerD
VPPYRGVAFIEIISLWGKIVKGVSLELRRSFRLLEGRSVIVHPYAKAVLATWLMAMQRTAASPETCLFPSRKSLNRPLRRGQAGPLLRQAYAACGLTGKLSTHTIRRTFGETVYEKSGQDLLKTQRAVGHKISASTVVYLHIDERDINVLILAL